MPLLFIILGEIGFSYYSRENAIAQTQTPATPQPVKMVTSTPAPKTPELPALPQTGEAAASAIVGLGIALIAISGVVVLEKKKN